MYKGTQTNSVSPAANSPLSIGETVRKFPEQFRRNFGLIVLCYGAAVVVLTIAWFVGSHGAAVKPHGKLNVGNLLRDPAQVADLPFYTGIISNTGILMWSAAAGIALLTAAVLRRLRPDEIMMRRFFLLGGILTLMLAVDDVFMIHEEVVPHYLFGKHAPVRIKEGVFYVLYAGFAAGFLWHCRAVILRRTDCLLFFMSLACLALSIVSDKAGLKHIVTSREGRFFIEDGFKFLGIVGWLVYFSRSAMQALLQVIAEKPA